MLSFFIIIFTLHLYKCRVFLLTLFKIMIMIQIFNKILFGSDAEAFLALDVNAKVNFIKKNTNQSNDDLINEFLTNLPMYKEQGDICIGCKLPKDDSNISKANANEVATDSQQGLVTEPSKLDNSRRPTKAKRRKG